MFRTYFLNIGLLLKDERHHDYEKRVRAIVREIVFVNATVCRKALCGSLD